MTAREAYEKAKKAQKRFPELEPDIIQDAEWAYRYALHIIKGRWLESEPTIMKNAHWAYCYARDMIKGRWPEAEPTIMQDVKWTYYYSTDVIKNRWSEAEPIIMQDTQYAFWYSKNIIKGRWLEAEPIIAKSAYIYGYIEHFFDETVVTKDQVDIIDWQRNKQVGHFAPARLFETKISLLDMVIE